MKKLIALVLVTLSFNSMATEWVEIYRNDTGIKYMDFDSVGRKTNTPTIWFKYEYHEPRADGWKRVTVKTRFNCTTETYTAITGLVHDVDGNQIDRWDNWAERNVVPDTLAALDMKFACTVFKK